MLQTLHLDPQDRSLTIGIEGAALRLHQDGLADIFAPLGRLARIVVHGRKVTWSTEALTACMQTGVPVLFLATHGRLAGLCLPIVPPRSRSDTAGRLEAAASLPGFRPRLENFCRAEERRAILALRPHWRGSVAWNELRPSALRRALDAWHRTPGVGPAVEDLVTGLAETLVAEGLVRRGVGARFLQSGAGAWQLPRALAPALFWPGWWSVVRHRPLLRCDRDGRLTRESARTVIAGFEGAHLEPVRDQLLARLVGMVAEFVCEGGVDGEAAVLADRV